MAARKPSMAAREALRRTKGREFTNTPSTGKIANKIAGRIKAADPKLWQEARDALSAGPARKASLMQSAETKVGHALRVPLASASRKMRILGRGLASGMLSPAALAEGVAGAAVKAATHEKFKREARAESKPTKGGMKRVKTKA